MDYLKLTHDKLSVDEISELIVDDSCGAVSLFAGITRDNFEGKKVVRLEYEAYEQMAVKALKSICEEIREKWPPVHSIAIYHRLGVVPVREASVVIAISSPHRRESLDAVSFCIDKLKATVPIWKKEVYEDDDPAWKENSEYTSKPKEHPEICVDKNLVQINVSCEELQKRIRNFIERKREQVNLSNVHDFILNKAQGGIEDSDTCARVRTCFVRRSDSKGHLKVHRVINEWGPQISRPTIKSEMQEHTGLPLAIAERVLNIEKFLNIGPVDPDIYKRLKAMEDKIAYLQSVSPEYAQFWNQRDIDNTDIKRERGMDFLYTADEINKKIEQLEKIAQSN